VRTRLDRTEAVDYQVLRSNDAWRDHQARTLVTAALIAWLKPQSVMDPACGDGSIVMTADRLHSIQFAHFGDISKPNIDHVIETSGKGRGWSFRCCATDDRITDVSSVDVMVLTEILEHLDDPDHTLRLARGKARYLIASSPEMRPDQVDDNPEHLWMFDREGYGSMLIDADWRIQQYTHLGFRTMYDFGIWVCS
jgi:2-polyprenyl-3-methyl-5-hydroxy-6-metoxy-1,4-benzoquinol methylase